MGRDRAGGSMAQGDSARLSRKLGDSGSVDTYCNQAVIKETFGRDREFGLAGIEVWASRHLRIKN
jgi:hypothetical protein